MFDKKYIQNEIDDLMSTLKDISSSCDCLEESDEYVDVYANLRDIINDSAILMNLANALLSEVKASNKNDGVK